MILDKSVWCIHSLPKDDHHLTITDIQRETTACFSHKAGEATIIHVWQQLEMWKVCAGWVPRQLTEERQKIVRVWHSIFLLSMRKIGMIYSSKWLLAMKVGSIFTNQKENQWAWFGKKQRKKWRENSRISGLLGMWHK